jgi:hypothetical protein
MSNEIQFSPIEVGNMSEIPPDAPVGQWVTSQRVKVRVSAKGDPMLVIDFKLEEALTEGNESSVGSKVTQFLVIRGANHQYVKMYRQQLNDLCEGLKIQVPRFTTLQNASDFDEFIAEVEGVKGTPWTTHKTDKATGEVRTEISFRAPRGTVSAASEESETPKKRSKRG